MDLHQVGQSTMYIRFIKDKSLMGVHLASTQKTEMLSVKFLVYLT